MDKTKETYDSSEKKLKVLQNEIKVLALDENMKGTDNKDIIAEMGCAWTYEAFLPALKDKKSFERYLTEFAEGKHLDDTLISTLLLFEMKYTKEIVTFLKEMKVEKDTKVYYFKELLLQFNDIVNKKSDTDKTHNERREEKKKSIDGILKGTNYKNLLESSFTRKSAILLASLLNSEESSDVSDLIELVKERNGRALTLIGINGMSDDDSDDDSNDDKEEEDKTKAEKKDRVVRWLKRAIGENDYMAYLVLIHLMVKNIEKKYKDYNKFKLSTTDEFNDLLHCMPVIVDLQLALCPKSSFLQPFFSFVRNYYVVSRNVRSTCVMLIAKILTNSNFNNDITDEAHKCLAEILDCDDGNKDNPYVLFVLDTMIQGDDYTKLVELCEAIHKKKVIPKDKLQLIELIGIPEN